MSKLSRVALVSAGLVALVATAGVSACALFSSNRPEPQAGTGPADIEAMVGKMEAATNLAAWQRTGAVSWRFAGRNEHLWDRSRDLIRVRWDDTEVLRSLAGDALVVKDEGAVVTDEGRRKEASAAAYARWVNDSFWLNPVAKLRDPGVALSISVDDERQTGLLASYTGGGLTPGDAYFWIVGDDGLPTAWRMWTSNIPVGGMRASWEGWETLATGAKVSGQHELGPVTLKLEDIAGAETLAALLDDGAGDPFAPLLEQMGRGSESQPEAGSSAESQPAQ